MNTGKQVKRKLFIGTILIAALVVGLFLGVTAVELMVDGAVWALKGMFSLGK